MGENISFSERMISRCGLFERKWSEWAATQPENICCAEHKSDRELDRDESLRRSWSEQEFRLVYKPCSQCRKPKRKTKPEREQRLPYPD